MRQIFNVKFVIFAINNTSFENNSIWSNFMRNDIDKKLCHFFVFTLLTRLRPIKVRILNCFLRVADHGLPLVLIEKIEKDKS